MKKFLCLLLAAVMALSLVACGSQPAADETKTNDKTNYVVDLSDITIGACVMSFEQEFMANLVVGYQEFMKQTGVNMLLTDGGNMEVEKQVTNVENYISAGVDGILVQCVSLEALKDTLRQAIDKGIPVGVYP